MHKTVTLIEIIGKFWGKFAFPYSKDVSAPLNKFCSISRLFAKLPQAGERDK